MNNSQMSSINYFFEDTKECRHQLPAKKWLQKCMSIEKTQVGCINFIFCSDNYLLSLNKKYLGKTYLTDVISFNQQQNRKDKKDLVFGDIYISIERVKENKKKYKTIFAKELKRVMIHGALHLIGYNDKNEKEKKLMVEKEDFYINLT